MTPGAWWVCAFTSCLALAAAIFLALRSACLRRSTLKFGSTVLGSGVEACATGVGASLTDCVSGSV